MTAATFALAALRANHQWHLDHDDHDGYPESELCDQTLAATHALEGQLPLTEGRVAEIYSAACGQNLRPGDMDLVMKFVRGLEKEFHVLPSTPAPHVCGAVGFTSGL
jgi:hypothetical protein